MGYETYTGIIAREVDTSEADRYLTILTAEQGKLECYAKGIRKQNSKLASQAGLMSYGEFVMYSNKDRRILTSAKSVESFYDIRMDIVKCAYAMHFLEIARDVIVEAQAFPQALQTLLNTLFVLCYRQLQPEFISRVFEIRILAIAGFAPMLDHCTICGAPLGTGESLSFAIGGDGAVCAATDCVNAAGRTVPISSGAIRAMRYVAGCGAGELFKFALSEAVLAELTSIVPPYLRDKFGKEYNKLEEAERYRAFERDVQKNAGARRRTT